MFTRGLDLCGPRLSYLSRVCTNTLTTLVTSLVNTLANADVRMLVSTLVNTLGILSWILLLIQLWRLL